jgi:hypothetical protein
MGHTFLPETERVLKPSSESWWLNLTREELNARAQQEAKRMQGSKGARIVDSHQASFTRWEA